jgi:putative ABC transport system ATP-binding protein
MKSSSITTICTNSTAVVRTQALGKTVAVEEKSLILLQDINMSIDVGTTVALTGESGAGKSSLLALLAGLDQATTGEVFLFGQALSSKSEEERADLRRHRIGFIFQNFQLLSQLDAIQNITVPLVLNGMPAKEALECAQYWLNQVGLGHRLQHMPRFLSGGEQQRIAIARAFSSNPVLIFADEPTANLDERTGERIMELLFGQQAQQGTTLVCVSHDHHLVSRCSYHYRVAQAGIQPI